MNNPITTSSVDRLLFAVLVVSLTVNVVLTYKLHRFFTIPLRPATAIVNSRPLTNAEAIEMSGKDAPSLGPDDAPVTVVVFSDFQCVYCREFASTLRDVESKAGSNVRIVVREMPLSIHPYARKEAELATCVVQQSGPAFWALYNHFFDVSSTLGENMTEGGIAVMSSRMDIDAGKLRNCVVNHQGAAQVDRDLLLATKYGINSTPTVFINGARATGEMRRPDSLMHFIQDKASVR